MIVDYTIDEAGSIIHIFQRGKHYEKRFTPYFFEPTRRGKFLSITDRSLLKIETTYPKDVPKLRSPKSYESDVLFPHRFILDKIKTINTDFSYLCFDIENTTENMPQDRNKAATGHSTIMTIAGSFVTPWNKKKNLDFVLYLKPFEKVAI